MKYICNIMYNSHSLSRHTLFHSSLASLTLPSGDLPDQTGFFVTTVALNCFRIHLSYSSFLLPLNMSNTQISTYNSYIAHLYSTFSPNSPFHTIVMYIHSCMVTTTTMKSYYKRI